MAKKPDPPAELADVGLDAENFEVAPRWVDDANPDSPRMSPQTVVDEMLREQRELRRKTMLTWDSRSELRTTHGKPIPRDKLKPSGFDGRAAYIGPIANYWVQNLKIYFGKIRQVSLEDVPEQVVDKRGEVIFARSLVRTALKTLRQQAAASDPLLCRVCSQYKATSPTDFAAHMATSHPEELAVLAEKLNQEAGEPAATAAG
jgi:hypothetical protein